MAALVVGKGLHVQSVFQSRRKRTNTSPCCSAMTGQPSSACAPLDSVTLHESPVVLVHSNVRGVGLTFHLSEPLAMLTAWTFRSWVRKMTTFLDGEYTAGVAAAEPAVYCQAWVMVPGDTAYKMPPVDPT